MSNHNFNPALFLRRLETKERALNINDVQAARQIGITTSDYISIKYSTNTPALCSVYMYHRCCKWLGLEMDFFFQEEAPGELISPPFPEEQNPQSVLLDMSTMKRCPYTCWGPWCNCPEGQCNGGGRTAKTWHGIPSFPPAPPEPKPQDPDLKTIIKGDLRYNRSGRTLNDATGENILAILAKDRIQEIWGTDEQRRAVMVDQFGVWLRDVINNALTGQPVKPYQSTGTTMLVTDRQRTATLNGDETFFQQYACKSCNACFTIEVGPLNYCPVCGEPVNDKDDVSA